MQTHELQSLEARLREMEERLKTAGRSAPSSNSNSPQRGQWRPVDTPASPPEDGYQQGKRAPASLDLEKQGKRLAGGVMPPTPGASEGISKVWGMVEEKQMEALPQ